MDALDDEPNFFDDTDDIDSDNLEHSGMVTGSTSCGDGIADVVCRQSPTPQSAAFIGDSFEADNLPALPHPGSTPLEEAHSPEPVQTALQSDPSPLNDPHSPLSHPHSEHPLDHSPLHQSHPSSPLQENVPAESLNPHMGVGQPLKAGEFVDDRFPRDMLDIDVSDLNRAHVGMTEDVYTNTNAVPVTPTATRPAGRDKLAQRKQRNKESARRYREKQVARRRHLENYTRTLCEQNRELESLHDRLLRLTCERSLAMEVRGASRGGNPAQSMYGYGVESATYSSSNPAASPMPAYHHPTMHAISNHNILASQAASPPAYPNNCAHARTQSQSHPLAQVRGHANPNVHHAAYISTLSSPSVSHNMQATLLPQRSESHDQGILLPGSVHTQGNMHQIASGGERSAPYARGMYVHASTNGFERPIQARPIAPSLAPSERQFAAPGRL